MVVVPLSTLSSPMCRKHWPLKTSCRNRRPLFARQPGRRLRESGGQLAGRRPATEPYQSPIVFSQSGIKSVGLHAGGRLKLLDSFAPDRRRNDHLETASIAEVQIEELDRQLTQLANVDAQIAELAPKEQQLSLVSASAANRAT
jgi:hypothetical protein